MIGSDDPEYQVDGRGGRPGGHGAVRLRRRAVREEAARPARRPDQRAHPGRGRGRAALASSSSTCSSCCSPWPATRRPGTSSRGAMVAFFDHPDQWERLAGRPLAAPVGRRGDAALRHPGHALPPHRPPADVELGGQQIAEGDKVVFLHISANRDETVFDDPDDFDITRTPNHHMAFGGGGPHFCLGANLARMEIRVMFERPARPHARHPARRRGPAPAVELHQRREAHPGGLHPVGPGRRLRGPARQVADRRARRPVEPVRSPSNPVDPEPAPNAEPMRFHQAVTFLPLDEVVRALTKAADAAGLRRASTSRTTCSTPGMLRVASTPTRRPRTVPRSGRRRRRGPTRCA